MPITVATLALAVKPGTSDASYFEGSTEAVLKSGYVVLAAYVMFLAARAWGTRQHTVGTVHPDGAGPAVSRKE